MKKLSVRTPNNQEKEKENKSRSFKKICAFCKLKYTSLTDLLHQQHQDD